MVDPFRDQYTKIPNTLYYKMMTRNYLEERVT